jgi:hypothetical protein
MPALNFKKRFAPDVASMKKRQTTIAAWGVHGAFKNRSVEVLNYLLRPHYLALTKDDLPRHPLYLKKDLKPTPYCAGWRG